MTNLLTDYSFQTWISALIGATVVGLVGVFPLLIVPNEQYKNEKPYLEILLSIAVVSQLADVFLHLLPEAFAHLHASSIYIGLWTLIGLLIFYLIEQIFPDNHHEQSESKIQRSGYLNLLANFIDNFTHGAAIGGSFAVSRLVGVTTLTGILIHEIPHEVGDFAIFLKSGLNRWHATKAQMIIGLGGILGACFALLYSNSVQSTLWVLPFTSGAFLYITLVKTVPDLLKENDFMYIDIHLDNSLVISLFFIINEFYLLIEIKPFLHNERIVIYRLSKKSLYTFVRQCV